MTAALSAAGPGDLRWVEQAVRGCPVAMAEFGGFYGEAVTLLAPLLGAGRELLVIRLDGAPVGFLDVDEEVPGDLGVAWFVLPERRRQGLATAALVALAAARPSCRLIAAVSPSNEASLRAARRAGFADTGCDESGDRLLVRPATGQGPGAPVSARPGTAVDGTVDGVERIVPVADGVELWVEERGDPGAPAVLLVMGAASSGLFWPDALVDRLAERYRVIRYDHRDTGRSTGGSSYPLRALATDAVAVLDALGVDRAHVVGMSLGGTLSQLLLLDHPDRLRSAVLFCTGALGGAPGEPAPGPSDDLLRFWATMADPRDESAELAWRVEHWRLLHADDATFDPQEWQALEERVAAHSGGFRSAVAHATADQGGLVRGAELAAVAIPVLVLEAPADPAYPPPNAQRLAEAIGTGPGGVPARLVTVAGMGHALPAAVVPRLADAVVAHLDSA